jgi:hypothetical protein
MQCPLEMLGQPILRGHFCYQTIHKPKDTFVRNVTSGTQNTDATRDMSNKMSTVKDALGITYGFGSTD